MKRWQDCLAAVRVRASARTRAAAVVPATATPGSAGEGVVVAHGHCALMDRVLSHSSHAGGTFCSTASHLMRPGGMPVALQWDDNRHDRMPKITLVCAAEARGGDSGVVSNRQVRIRAGNVGGSVLRHDPAVFEDNRTTHDGRLVQRFG